MSKCVHMLEGHTGTVVCLRFDDTYVATAGGFARGADGEEILDVDSSVRLWDIRTMGCIQNLEQQPPGVPPHNPDGDPVLSLDLRPSVLVSVRCMAFPSGLKLFLAGNISLLKTKHAPRGGPLPACVLQAHSDQNIRVWDFGV